MSTPYPAYGRSEHDGSSTFKAGPDDRDRIARAMSRTPSPTPSEAKALNEPLFSMAQMLNWRFWIRKEWTKYYFIVIIILTLTALISIYHHQIVKALTPVTNEMHKLKYGFLIPIGVLFVISFPPLFGHEIVAILCGVVWGLWVGFAIVCAGTFLGEVGNFYAFKMCCKARGEKMEKTQIPYACLARCVRTGGFKIALVARFSAIPGHFTTAVFSTCGMNIFVFAIAAILSLPKQFITVYVGVILEQTDDGTTSTKSRLISDGVLGMALAKPAVIYERRKARQGKMQGIDLGRGMYGAPNDSESSIAYSGDGVDIPLTAKPGSGYAYASSSNTLTAGAGAHPRYDYERQQRQRQAEEWAAQRRQYEEHAPRNPIQQQQDDMTRYNPYSPRGDGMGEHQQWDAQGRAVGYTPGPGGAVVWAPQPQQARTSLPMATTTAMATTSNNNASGGRTPIAPGSVYFSQSPTQQHIPGEAEVYAHGRAPAHVGGSGDEAGWEMMGAGVGAEMRQVQQPPSRQQTQPPSRQQTQPPSRQQTQPPSRQQTQPPSRQQTQAQPPPPPQYQAQAPADPETPTQAQYANYVEPAMEPASAASTTLAYLKSPFEDPDPEHTLDGSSSSTTTFGGHAHAVEPTGASYHTAYGSESEHEHGSGPQRANSLATESASEYSYDYAMQHGRGHGAVTLTTTRRTGALRSTARNDTYILPTYLLLTYHTPCCIGLERTCTFISR
ncbi:hypothetical protein MSAN_01168400 [Mycena sanguinolenta]|uniref:Golgi apparatus membrane protein TVP38 n=1 Tax=Mycena sanguinolenta TaxID=230812 RepID=A0A8H6YMH0_9AGAR|nr:hypothetical protein MSAN_01168400 [Mycena sanguinolenta]